METNSASTNAFWDTTLGQFVGSLATTIICLVLAVMLPSWLAWIPYVLGVVAIYVAFGTGFRLIGEFVLGGVRLGQQAARRRANDERLRAEPALIEPIQRTPNSFCVGAIRRKEPGLPRLDGEWLSMKRDHETLKAYANQLDSNRSKAREALSNAVSKFTSDRNTLVLQQLQILRRAYRARRAIENVADLPAQELSVERLPVYAHMTLPPMPIYLSGAQLAARYPLTTGGAGSQLGQLLANPNNGNLIAAAIVTAAMVVMAKSNLSRAVRALEEARGDLLRFYADARGTITTLGRAHEEIVASSERLKAAENEIGELMSALSATLPPTPVRLSELSAGTREKVTRLWQWIICADAVYAREAV